MQHAQGTNVGDVLSQLAITVQAAAHASGSDASGSGGGVTSGATSGEELSVGPLEVVSGCDVIDESGGVPVSSAEKESLAASSAAESLT